MKNGFLNEIKRNLSVLLHNTKELELIHSQFIGDYYESCEHLSPFQVKTSGGKDILLPSCV